jgi:cytochrome c oxidase subunit IV
MPMTSDAQAASSVGAEPHGTPPPGAHVMSLGLLAGVWLALALLTALTVAAATVDLGPRPALLVALAIATIKAVLVLLFFMHLLYDRRFYLLIFTGALLFVFVFINFVMSDSSAYQPDIRAREQNAAPRVDGGNG